MKVYIERNNIQVELIRLRNKCRLYWRWKLWSGKHSRPTCLWNWVHCYPWCVATSLVNRYAVNRAHRYRESVFGTGFLASEKPVRVPYRIIKYLTLLNHEFNISSSFLLGNNHALPQHLPNPVHFLAIRRVYFHSNTANHPAASRHVWYWCGFKFTECACADWPRSARVMMWMYL